MWCLHLEQDAQAASLGLRPEQVPPRPRSGLTQSARPVAALSAPAFCEEKKQQQSLGSRRCFVAEAEWHIIVLAKQTLRWDPHYTLGTATSYSFFFIYYFSNYR